MGREPGSGRRRPVVHLPATEPRRRRHLPCTRRSYGRPACPTTFPTFVGVGADGTSDGCAFEGYAVADVEAHLRSLDAKRRELRDAIAAARARERAARTALAELGAEPA